MVVLGEGKNVTIMANTYGCTPYSRCVGLGIMFLFNIYKEKKMIGGWIIIIMAFVCLLVIAVVAILKNI